MASLPSGSDRILEIRTANADIVIKSKGKQASGFTGASSLKVVAVDLEKVNIPAQNILEEYLNHQGTAVHEFTVAPMFFEQTDYVVNIKARNGEKLEFRSNSRLIEDRVTRVWDDDPTQLSGVVNFGNNVGYSDFRVLADGHTVIEVKLEVYPSKISYKDDYEAMMADINNLVNESILDFMKKTYQVFVPDHKINNVPAVFFTILQGIYEKYLQAANRVTAVPNHKLVTEHEVLPAYKANRIDDKTISWMQKHPDHVKRTNGKLYADRLLTAKKTITYDTQENRLVKYMLRSTMRRIQDFRARYLRSTLKPDQKVLADAHNMEQELRRMLTNTFLAEVAEYNAASSMSLVFGMAPGYRELYKYFLLLQNGLTVGGDIFHISVKETAQLYEYWCFIKLYSILKERYQLDSPDIIRVDRKGVTVDIQKGKDSEVAFLNARTGEKIRLFYNATEKGTQTVDQKPDNILELEKKGARNSYRYVFDAKYRIEMNPDGIIYKDRKPGPKIDDINTMHRYRDAIVYENKESRFIFEKTMFGAYILFPYSNEEEYKSHHFYHSIETVNIGGLPFLPSATTLVTKLLDELITDSPESAFERASLPYGIEERISHVNWKQRDVLIGTFRTKKQYQACKNNKFYYIPAKRIKDEELPVHYVALLQTKSLFPDSPGIYTYGEVIRAALVKRKDIQEVPVANGNPYEQYYRFQVREWVPLNKPILPKEAGFINEFTNMFLLENVEYVPELLLQTEEEYRLYMELKRRTGEALENNESVAGFQLGDIKVMFDNGRIFVYQNENQIGKCEAKDFAVRPNATFRSLLQNITSESIAD